MTTAPTNTAPSPAALSLRGLEGREVPARVVDFGTGRPFVFLHGLVGLNDHWEQSAHALRPHARAVMLEFPLLDLQGEDCSIHGVTELTIRFLERHLREPAVLVGNSFGGHVALRVAIERPELVAGLVLAGSSGLTERTTVREVQLRPSREWLVEKIGELFFDRAKMNQGDVDRAHRELSRRGGARAMVKLSRSARRNHMGDRLGEIKAPTLLVWGKQDAVTPPEAADQFNQLIRGSTLVWLDRCGHAPMIEQPEQFASLLIEFNRSLSAATTPPGSPR
ncbi:MAG: alpha/beta hydrolase [Phycisphaerales bacterium]